MASTIKIKNSTTTGSAPTSLVRGELAINVADGNLFYGNGSSVKQNFVVDELEVKGNLTAQQYIVSSSVTYTTQSFSSGSTVFGDTQDDTHQFTGSINITGSVTAIKLIGNGSGITNLPSQTDENFTTADHTKLDGIEANADVTDTSNVTAAGALMDSEVTSLSLIKGLTAAQISGAFDAASASLASDIPTNNNQLTNGAGYTTNTGTVDTSGTPADNQVAIFTDADTIEGSNKLKFDSSILDIASTNSDVATIRIYGGAVGTVSPYISPFGAHTSMKFGDGTSGHTFDFQNNKIAFDSDATNTYIMADTSTPENLEIHADGNIELRADDELQIFGNVSSSGTLVVNTIDVDTDIDIITNNKFFRGKLTGGATRNVIGIDDSDNVTVGNSTSDSIKLIGDVSGSGTVQLKPRLDLPKTSTTDGDYYGTVVYFGSNTSGMTAGTIYYYRSTGAWVSAQADSTTTSLGLLGVALGSAASDGVLIQGTVTLNHDPGALGDTLYLSDINAGRATSTVPSSTNDVVRVIGYCLDASNGQIYFNPSSDHMVHA